MWRFLTELVTYFRLKRKKLKLEVEKLALENSVLSRRLEELKSNSEPSKKVKKYGKGSWDSFYP
ncbi:MAG: hypothetical protein DRP61_05955 [Candidatus Omnitrophota bacterium]|nr:MAG: hypothetical protein DRP61_05955 [Candidatus Omnitrophota bacterium]